MVLLIELGLVSLLSLTWGVLGVATLNGVANYTHYGHPAEEMAPSTDLEPLSGLRLYIPDRNLVFPTSGRLLNFSYYHFWTADYSRFQVMSLSYEAPVYTVNSRSEWFDVSTPNFRDWTTVYFENSYLRVGVGEFLGLLFNGSNTIPYYVQYAGANCTPESAFQSYVPPSDDPISNNTFVQPLNVSQCRNYSYSTPYIADGNCIPVTLRYTTGYDNNYPYSYTITGYLEENLNQSIRSYDSMCWNVTAPPRVYDEESPVVELYIKTRPDGTEIKHPDSYIYCEGAGIEVIDGDGRRLFNVCSDTDLKFYSVFSFTDTMIINLTTGASPANISARLLASAVKWVPQGYYDQFSSQAKTDKVIVIGAVMGGIAAWLVIVIIACCCAKSNKKKTAPTSTKTTAPPKSTTHERPPRLVKEPPKKAEKGRELPRPKTGQLPATRLPPLASTTQQSGKQTKPSEPSSRDTWRPVPPSAQQFPSHSSGQQPQPGISHGGGLSVTSHQPPFSSKDPAVPPSLSKPTPDFGSRPVTYGQPTGTDGPPTGVYGPPRDGYGSAFPGTAGYSGDASGSTTNTASLDAQPSVNGDGTSNTEHLGRYGRSKKTAWKSAIPPPAVYNGN